LRKGKLLAIYPTGGLRIPKGINIRKAGETTVVRVRFRNRKTLTARRRILVLLIAFSAAAIGFGLHFAIGQEAEVPRSALPKPPAQTATTTTPAVTQPPREAEVPRSAIVPPPTAPAEVPRPALPQPGGQTPPTTTPAVSPPAGQMATAITAATSQPAVAQKVNRELLDTKSCGLVCHFNDQFGKMLLMPMMTDETLVKMKYLQSLGPPELAKPRPADYRQRIIMSRDKYYQSAHGRMECIDCHDAVTTSPHPQYIPVVTCDKCHLEQQKQYGQGMHGQAVAKGDPQAPDCVRCHGGYHEMEYTTSPLSPMYKLTVPNTCASCHADPAVLVNHKKLKTDAVETYRKTIHGQAILLSGTIGSAACSDCHNPHRVLNHTDPASSVSLRNIVFTCGNCHRNDLTTFTASIHGRSLIAANFDSSPTVFAHSTSTTAPVCSTCHPGHGVIRTNIAEFQLNAVEVCGSCHTARYATYRDTYHGKVMRYGGLTTARCDDCHGYHSVYETTSTLSSVAPSRIVETCKPCHAYSNEKFVQFIAHLEPGDKTYPQTYYSWLFMTLLLVGTMGFFVVHSILWLIRELADSPKRKARLAAEGPGATYRIQRFNLTHRLTHAILFISVIGLAVTGLPLRYHTPQWGQWIFGLFGGPAVPRVLHRIFAALTLLYAGMHFVYLWNLWRRAPKQPILKMVFGPSSMMPNWTDVKQFFQHLRWFFFLGPNPKFGRWTYWEKFDYWAVFWGVAIIGVSGLVMALPRITAHLFPGWIFNVTLIIHSDEALLAASFLFAIHFFHVHLRPEKFPIDHVIFTGSMTPQEMETERPLELEQLKAEGRLEAKYTGAPNVTQLAANRVIAAVTLAIGLALLVGMFWTEILARLF
jgi:cytochrome b subunit of formate dehydrogenase